MKHMNFTQKPSDIKMVFIIHPNEFTKKNIKVNLLTFLPEDLQNSVLVLSLENDDLYSKVIDQLSKLPSEAVISVSDSKLYKKLVNSSTLPKKVGMIKEGNILPNPVQYFNFSAKALYLYANLNHNKTCFNHLVYRIKKGVSLVTEKPRKLISPTSEIEVKKAFRFLMTQEKVGADIEATSLRFYDAELVSISLAIDEQRGYTFHVKNCDFIKYMVLFFKKFKGRIIWHNGSYDIKVLAYKYFNSDSRELYRTYEDTMFLHYICTNSPERFPRDLGTLVADLCGEYKLTKKEITDMMNVDVQKVCEYNLDDARGTYWLYETYRDQIHSEFLYDKFKKWQWYLTQTELAGMPFSKQRLEEVDKILYKTIEDTEKAILKLPDVITAMGIIRDRTVDKINAKRVKQIEYWEKDLEFNPNSSDHLRVLLFEVMGLTPVKQTPSGKPSTDAKSLVKLRLQTPENKRVFYDLLEDISKASKMVSTFTKALREKSVERDGWNYLHGSYNLARVVSGRLSSSDPNMQNLPSGTSLGKLFKSIFSTPEGWLWGGADYASLEERINTILTKDPNKEAVYFDGYDGHSFRAFNYFPNELKELHEKVAKAKTKEDRVALINSIETDFKALRSKSKNPTFLLQYLGTAFGLVMNCGFSEKEAKEIYDNYYKLYEVSAKWLQEELLKVADQGYAEVAYGLRVYCYGITRVLLNSNHTPRAIQEFIRTLGNAIGGQSYGQLTVDAGYKFLKRVYDANLQDKVFTCASIHDANYVTWVDNPIITSWVNKNLIECMMDITELPELQGQIPLPAQLDIHLPDWSKPRTLQNNMSPSEIEDFMKGITNDS